MTTTLERIKASIPFIILSLFIVWLGYHLTQMSLSLDRGVQGLESSTALSAEVDPLRAQYKAIADEVGVTPLPDLKPKLDDALSQTFQLAESPQYRNAAASLGTSVHSEWEGFVDSATRLAQVATSPMNPSGLKIVLQDLLDRGQTLSDTVQTARAETLEQLTRSRPASMPVILGVTIIALLLVLLLDSIFTGQIRTNMILLRDTLLQLNQNKLDLNSKVTVRLQGWMRNVYPLPKIAHLLNCFLEKHRDVIQKIQTSADNCENASSLIRNCHKEIFEGTRVQASAADETSSSTFQMAATLNEIATNVQGLTHSAKESSNSIQEMDQSTQHITEASEDLFNLVNNSSSSINELVASIGQIRENLNSLTTSIDSTSSSVSEIDASIKEVELMAKESAQLSQQSTVETSEQGVKAVDKAIEGMHRIRKTVQETERMVRNLNQKSQEIGEVLNVIDEVAEQTNLLALNAAIIASQAGEHGKGFAVVADEIKALAERTTSSIGQIEKAISSVQEETDTVSKSIEQSVSQVQEGVTLSEETKRVLERILTQSRKSSEMSWKIEKAAVEQVRSVDHVHSETQNVNQMVRQIYSAVQEQEKGGGIIREMIEKLKNFTEELRKSMNEEMRGSRQISSEIENFFIKIQEINRSIQEHRRGSEQIARSIERIRVITEGNINMTDDLNTAIGTLGIYNEELQKEIQHFHFNRDKKTLRLGIVPTESEVKMQIKFGSLAHYLEQKLQQKIELRVAENLEAAARELGQGETDFAYLTPSTYIEAKKLYGCEVILKAIRNHSPFYRSVIAVRDSSSIRTVADIKGKRFGFGDPKSTSSYHVPRAMLAKEKLSLKELGSHEFLGHHDAVAWAIVNGDVDAGGLLEPVANNFASKGLKILKASENIPEFNFCVHPNMDSELREQIIKALLELDEERVEDRGVLKSIEHDYNGFVPASASDYRGIEEMMELTEKEIA